MGVDVYAISCNHQTDLDMEIRSFRLDPNLRNCGINVWKGIFFNCTGEHICDYQWLDDIPLEKIKEWAIKTRNVKNETDASFIMESCGKIYNSNVPNATIEDIEKLCKYLELCVKYDAQIRVL
jgi:hypothetical protein